MRSTGAWGSTVLAVAALVSGCSSTTEEPPATTGGETTVAIRIAGRTVQPTNGRAEARVGQPIVLKVDSDTADELHVHSDPAHTFAVEPRAGQEFRFTVTVPGQVEVELHEAGKTVTTLQVRP
ncbi:hypothetical protein AB0H76_03540 [Nocardia sp. NPDC050712]|uniref:hypothetical protein n=1 Tax=Nocardia sp. NPDC050712 TaxID=3155518 RepID=UPI0033C893CA